MTTHTLKVARNGASETIKLTAGSAAKIEAQSDTVYSLLDGQGNLIRFPRTEHIGADLWVYADEAAAEPVLVLQNYFSNFPVLNPHHAASANGTFVTAADASAALETSAVTASEVAAADIGNPFTALQWGTVALAAAGIVGAVAAGRGGNRSSQPSVQDRQTNDTETAVTPSETVKPEPTKPAVTPSETVKPEPTKPAPMPSETVKPEPTKPAVTPSETAKPEPELPKPAPVITLNPIAPEDLVRAVNAGGQVTVTGTVQNAADGDKVSLNIGGRIYEGIVKNGAFGIDVPAAGLAGQTVGATVQTASAVSAAAEQSYSAKIKLPEPVVTFEPVTPDNIINAAEAKEQITVAAKVADANDNDKVTVTVGGQVFETTVQNGGFSLPVDGALLAAADKIVAEIQTADKAGNTAETVAEQVYTVDTDIAAPVIVFNPIAKDDIVNLLESREPHTTVTGRVENARNGDWIVLSVGDAQYRGQVSDGLFAVPVDTKTLLNHAKVSAALTTSDEAKNSASTTAERAYRVDTEYTPSVSLGKIATDNVLNIAESKDRVTVSGTVTDVKDGEEVIVSCGCESCTGIKWIDVAARVQNGGFTVDFEGVKLAKDGYNVIKAKVTSTDDAGNEATAETSQTYTKDLTAPVVGVSVGNVADDNILTKAEQSQPVHRIRGELSGVKADETVQSVRISVNGKTFDAEVAGSRYSADVPSADLAQDKAVRVTAVVADAAGNTDIAEEVREYGVGTPKPVLALGKIAVDNLINKSEADTDSFVLSGTAENVSDGTAVTLAVGRQQTTATVYGGVFQTTVGKAFFGITDTTVTANGTLTARLGYVGDDGKNAQVTASRGYKVDLANTSITLDKITGDNMIDAGEAAQNTVTVSGSVNNGKEGMPVTISIGGKSFTAEVKADGSFRTDIELPRKTDGKYGISASVEKIDGAGNTVLNDKGAAVTVSASQGFVIDTAPPAGQVVFDPIASDNVINEAESLQNKITVSGKVSGLNDGDDVSAVTVNIRGESYAAKVMGTSFSIDVPAYVMRGAASVSAAAEVKDAGGRSGTTAATVQDYGYQTAAPEIEVAVDSINGGKAVRAAALSETVLIEGSLVSGATVSDGTQKVSVRIGGKDYAAETAGSRWTLAVPATALATAEGRLKLSATVTAEDRYGNTAKHTASREYTVDTVAPKPVIAIESVADDDIIGSAELAAGGNAVIAGKVSGEFKTGDILTITAGGHTQEIALDGSGVFRAEVPVSSLAAVAKTAVTVSLTTTDDAGNTATVQAERAYGVQTDNLKIELDRITGDDFVNVTEAQQNITISGRVSGTDAQAGQTVVLTVNGEQLSAEVQPNLTFGIDVPAAKLLADNGYTVQASVENGKEETAKTARSYGVAPEAAAKIDITAIDGDFTVDVAQADAMVRIGGIIETAGLFAEGMNGERLRQITLDIGGKTYNAGITAERGFFIDVPAAELAAADGLAVKIVKIDADKVVPDLIQTGTNSYKVENSAAYANVEVKNIRFDTPHIVQVSDGVYQVKGGNVLPQTVISGTVGGTAKEGDTVSIEAGGKIHTAKVEADNTFTARIATADLAADDSRSITAVLHTTDRAGNAVTVSDSEAYAVRNVSDGLFASLHSRPAKINSDHTDEGYNFPYFIDKAGNLGGGSFGIKLGGFSDEPKVVKYHFMTLDEIRAEKMSDGYVNLDTLTTYSSYLQDLVRSAYQEISAVTNIVFEEVGSVAEANTNYMMGNLINGFQGSAAIAYNSGKVVWNSGQNYMAWGDGFLRYTVLHEIIHTLGMRHSDKAQGGSYDGDYAKESNVEFTLMSYNAYTNNSLFLDLGKLRTYDLAYLQYAHGISKNVRTGNDTYTFKNYNVYSQDADRYIWDAGGTDTFDASHEKQGVHVDLTPGSWIYTGGKREKTFGLEGTSTTDLRKYFGLSDDAKLALGWRVNNSVTLNDYTEGQAFIGFGTQIENLAGSAYGDTLSGNNADNSISGNAGDDLISGGTGNDWLDGGSGADTLAGGSGNDSYIVDDAADTVTEAAQEGEDSVYSHVSHTLGAHLEHLTLLGSTVVSGTGNGGANTLTGNGTANILDGAAGDDRIIGGKGSDTLTGGAGRDTFVFDSVLDGSADTVTDFTAGEDIIELAGSIFQSLTVNVMAEWEHYVQYHADTGFLTYDSDGQGQADAVHFATLDKDLAIDRTSFNVV